MTVYLCFTLICVALYIWSIFADKCQIKLQEKKFRRRNTYSKRKNTPKESEPSISIKSMSSFEESSGDISDISDSHSDKLPPRNLVISEITTDEKQKDFYIENKGQTVHENKLHYQDNFTINGVSANNQYLANQ